MASFSSDSSEMEAPPIQRQSCVGKKAAPPKRPKSLVKHREHLQRMEERRKQKEIKKKKKKEKQQRINERAPPSTLKPANLLIARKKTSQEATTKAASNAATTGRKKKAPPSSSSSEDETCSSDDDYTNVFAKKPKAKESVPWIHPTKRKRKELSNASSFSESSEDEDSEFDKKTTAKQKRRKRKRPLSSNSSQKQQQQSKGKHQKVQSQWTEVLAPGHVLADEVRAYVQEQQDSLSSAEQNYLQQWVTHVQSDLNQQNKALVENIQQVQALRHINKQSNRLQSQILQQKRTLQALKQETCMYQVQAQEMEEQQSTMDSASWFLQSLQDLAQQQQQQQQQTAKGN